MRQVKIREFVPSTDIVGLSVRAGAEQHVDCAAVVLDV